MAQTYCDFVATLPVTDLHRIYHDTAYGFPIKEDKELFARLVLEINQAGLSWAIILKKQTAFYAAYDNFDPQLVADYTALDVERLLSNPGIIRNRLKVWAAIHNAQVILQLQQLHGSFHAWLEQHAGSTKQEWVKLFSKSFKFTGGEIVGEFLMSIGYLPGAHEKNCPIYQQVLTTHPVWSQQHIEE